MVEGVQPNRMLTGSSNNNNNNNNNFIYIALKSNNCPNALPNYNIKNKWNKICTMYNIIKI